MAVSADDGIFPGLVVAFCQYTTPNMVVTRPMAKMS